MKIIKGVTKSAGEAAHDFMQMQKERHENPDLHRGLPFGHVDLDKLTGGCRKQELIVIAGQQKAGKTTIALGIMKTFAERVQPGEAILYISLEMGFDSIVARVLSNIANIDVTKFRDYQLEERDWDPANKAVEILTNLPILFNVGCYNIAGVESIIAEHKEIRVVIIDYFQLMSSDDANTKRWEQLEAMSRNLKRIAVTENCSVIIITQQTRDALKSIEKQKDPNTMAGTQSLARDCDLMLIILPYQKDGKDVPHMRNIYVALSRNSGSGITLETIFSGHYCRWGAPINNFEKLEANEQEAWWNK